MLVMNEVCWPEELGFWGTWTVAYCIDTGIDVVRNRIKGFAQKKVTLPPGRQKIVILDEADR
jgi:hypothetical protein